MILVKRFALSIIAAVIIIYIYYKSRQDYHATIQGLSQRIGLGDLVEDEDEQSSPSINVNPSRPKDFLHADPIQQQHTSDGASAFYPAGTVKQPGESYTRGIVIGRLTSENVTWLDAYAPTDESLKPYIYVVDDLTAPLHTPLNKGHEAMVYLTYIIDHYDSLPDVSIFMHPHQRAWHTPELLNHDAVEAVQRLSSERITREGYMNLRCHWDPGCPTRISPGSSYRDNLKREEIALAAAWAEMFPSDPIPQALGAPCCAQFAVASHRIRSIPKPNFERYRNWLIRTKETDWISGRVFEYLWHKIFTDQAKLCPDARACYCDGYGICFATSALYEFWFDNHHYWRDAVKELEKWTEQARIVNTLGNWKKVEEMKLDIPVPGRDIELQQEIDQRFAVLTKMRSEAIQNGTSAELRARVAGRFWYDGDGF